MPLTQDNQYKNEDVPLIDSTGGIEDNDNWVIFVKIVKKLFVKSARKNKLSPDKLSSQSSVGTVSQYQLKGNNIVCCCKTIS